MRRITMWIVSTISALVLLFSYRTSTMGPAGPAGAGAGSAGAGAGAGSAGSDPSAGSGSGSGSGSASGNGSTAVNGTVAQTRWGPVQVQVRISSGRIVDVTALQVPSGNRRDQQINAYAVPRLREEVLAAQSARIDTVSGATVTSDGYVRSLQAALDAAHFKG